MPFKVALFIFSVLGLSACAQQQSSTSLHATKLMQSISVDQPIASVLADPVIEQEIQNNDSDQDVDAPIIAS